MTAPEVAAAFESFPNAIRQRLMDVRDLILTVGNQVDPIAKISESLKWGEPSYSTISGSPIRLAVKKNDTDKFAIYFHCQTKLIRTFRELFPNTFSFEGNRAIVFHRTDPIPKKELRACIEAALFYHRRKKKPFLGINLQSDSTSQPMQL